MTFNMHPNEHYLPRKFIWDLVEIKLDLMIMFLNSQSSKHAKLIINRKTKQVTRDIDNKWELYKKCFFSPNLPLLMFQNMSN